MRMSADETPELGQMEFSGLMAVANFLDDASLGLVFGLSLAGSFVVFRLVRHFRERA
ncbi:MAG: hypothetical protein AAGJ84_07390 [Pseudomonadota bacterium]